MVRETANTVTTNAQKTRRRRNRSEGTIMLEEKTQSGTSERKGRQGKLYTSSARVCC